MSVEHRSTTRLSDLLALRQEALRLPMARRGGQHSPQGGHRSHLRGRGMEFAEFRPYQAGDDIRAIDWHLTARKNKAFTRLYQEEIEQPVFLLVDQRSGMYFGSRLRFKSVLAAEAATLLVWATLKRQDRVGGMILGSSRQDIIRPARREQSALRFIHALDRACHDLTRHEAEPGIRTSLLEATRELRRLAPAGSLCYLISDWHELDTELADWLCFLGRHLQLVLMVV